MTDLSPQAQAVLDAYNHEARPEPHHQREAIAAALRAAAGLISSVPDDMGLMSNAFYAGRVCAATKLLSIATELGGTTTNSTKDIQ